jgi:hypothetical protein
MRETGRYPISSPFDRIAIPQLANYRATRFHAAPLKMRSTMITSTAGATFSKQIQ